MWRQERKSHRTACSWGEITMVHNQKKIKLLRVSKFNSIWGSNMFLSHSSLSCFTSYLFLGLLDNLHITCYSSTEQMHWDMWKTMASGMYSQLLTQPHDNRNATLDQLSEPLFLPTCRMLSVVISMISIGF